MESHVIFLTSFLLGGTTLAKADLVRAALAIGFAAFPSVASLPPLAPTTFAPSLFARLFSNYEFQMDYVKVKYKLLLKQTLNWVLYISKVGGDGRTSYCHVKERL
ncbi:hypothetical protein RHGRI_031720 [Rhododendron griersonianum]|uniref:Uncharacterized protein n=1 Tax=Rhododendron griersonianum TaxID=479676 RepID=A0AAV6IES0_9ERIC|nr:hypothetical protein RHGRI_031720 [Rhododendron griersonianum]